MEILSNERERERSYCDDVDCRITDFEYTVACAVFDMLDIVLVHGWLLDDQDDLTVRCG